MRLYLNGDYDVRGSYASLFLVMECGENDGDLQWPFSNEVTFSLLNQVVSGNTRQNITSSFWPDTMSNCFQRPQENTVMNDAYGIKKFYLIEQLKKDRHLFIKDNAMYIKIVIDFKSIKPGKMKNLIFFPLFYLFRIIGNTWYR